MNNFKSILRTILGIVKFIAIIKFFIFMLPFVIAIGILSYIVFKWKISVNRRKNHGESYNYYDKNSNGFDLCCIWGEAGIGKTRVFNEVFKKKIFRS